MNNQNPTPKISFISDFISQPTDVLELIEKTVDWDETFKVRKTASFGVVYQYSQKVYPKAPIPNWLLPIMTDIEKIFDFLPNNCLLNRYEDGKAKMGFHSDDTSQMVVNTGVVIISLGDARNITYRHKKLASIKHNFLLTSGSALYMDDKVQQEWLHAILPKQPDGKLRISLTFRKLIA